MFSGRVNCVCKNDCANKIDVLRQKELFDEFYALPNWSEKTIFLRSLATRIPVRKNLSPIMNIKKRDFHSEFFLYDSDKNRQKVCQTFILNMLQVSKTGLFRALESQQKNPTASELRGQQSTRKTKLKDINFAKSVIQNLASYESKYNMSGASPKCVHPDLNLKKLYQVYQDQCCSHKRNMISSTIFRRIWKTSFNLKFRKRSEGKCNVCDMFQVQLQPQILSLTWKEQLLEELKMHQKNEETVRDVMKNTIERSLEITSFTEVYTFSFQRPLEVPFVNSTNDVYFKKQLWVFNFCLYDEIRNKPYLYTSHVDQSVAGKGSQEIASCIYRHLNEIIPKETHQIILNSSTSFGENRNMKLAIMLKWILHCSNLPAIRSIEQRFFVRGHTYSSCDRCFRKIESTKKKSLHSICEPKDWINLISNTDSKFQVTQMKQKDFFSSTTLENLILSKNESTDGKKIDWHKFKTITYNKCDTNPFTFWKLESSKEDDQKSSFEMKHVPESQL